MPGNRSASASANRRRVVARRLSRSPACASAKAPQMEAIRATPADGLAARQSAAAPADTVTVAASHPHAVAGWRPTQIGDARGALQADLQDPAHREPGRRARIPPTNQGAGRSSGGPPLPRAEDLHGKRAVVPALPGRHRGPDRRPQPGPQRPRTLQHQVHGRRGHAVARERFRRPRRGCGPSPAVPAASHQHARPVLVPAPRSARMVMPSAWCGRSRVPYPYRCRTTGIARPRHPRGPGAESAHQSGDGWAPAPRIKAPTGPRSDGSSASSFACNPLSLPCEL